jgi:arabinose-5-phosphate isomerase
MLQNLLKSQRLLLDHFFENLDFKTANLIFERLLSCKGSILFSGVGKSGHIAQKIAATFVSTGTRALFLSPADALHGDIGFVGEGDVFVALSKSGESEELLDLFPFLEKRGASTIAIVSDPKSRLSSAASMSLCLPILRELCPYNLAPTTSAAAQLIFGDCLAIALMQAKKFSQEDFAQNHPAGFLGRKITLKVSDLMLKEKEIPLCRLDQTLIDVLHQLSEGRCGCLLAEDDEGRLQGIFTDGDLRRAIQTQGALALQKRIGELMTLSPKTISPGELAYDGMRKMEEDPARLITVLPVIEQEKIVGLLRMHDILQAGLH